MAGPVAQIAGAGTDRIYLLASLAPDLTRLTCMDLGGRRVWHDDVPASYLCPMRAADDGSVWIGLSRALRQYGPAGEVLRVVTLPLEESESLGSFLLAPDGFAVSLFQPQPSARLTPRVLRLDAEGKVVWTKTLPVGPVQYQGIVHLGESTGWKLEQLPAWSPKSWEPDRFPLLLSGSRLLASYYESGSGIGVSYCLDALDGALVWQTQPRPTRTRAIAGLEQFLDGVQGYGAFDTYLYDGDGALRQHWTTHGLYVVSEGGQVRLVEMENSSPPRTRFAALEPDGFVVRGPLLDGYLTTYPALSGDGRCAFFRNGELMVVDDVLEREVLFADRRLAASWVLSRMLLFGGGQLVFAVQDELWIVGTDLAPLAASPWPCGNANLAGNPVYRPAR